MLALIPWIGGSAALLTSLSYVPQVRKAFPAGSTKDLSLKTLVSLTIGLALWVLYGFLKGDLVIVSANMIGGGLSLSVLFCKLRPSYEALNQRHPSSEGAFPALRIAFSKWRWRG
jgi:MtN3 and saliva related transmembrane protein